MTHDPRQPSSLRLPSATVADELAEGYQPYALEVYYGEVINTLTFRSKDGNRFAKPYHLLHECEYDPSVGIRLTFADGVIGIFGRNLEPLFNLVSEFRVRWVSEATRSVALQATSSDAVIESISRGVSRDRR